MRTSIFFSAAILLFLEAARAQVVQWEIQKQQLNTNGLRLSRREAVVTASISDKNAQGAYLANVSIGTPPQLFSLLVDTGSSDLWVPDSNAHACIHDACAAGSFRPKDSSTFEVQASDKFEIKYADESSSKGDYFTDVFRIGNTTINNFTMGIGFATDIPFGLIGVGYAIGEASDEPSAKPYANLPVAMAESGAINSVAYSLYLNDLRASKGSIIFGGIDTEKYSGHLAEVDIIPTPRFGKYAYFSVNLTSVEATSPSGTDFLPSDYPETVVLDSGTTLSYLSTAIASKMWEEAGAEWQPNMNISAIPCSHSNHNGQFTFGFAGPDGPKVNVTLNELVLDISQDVQKPYRFEDGDHKGELLCAFGIQNQSKSLPFILGDTFLRSAYVVYDLTNNKVAIAPTVFNTTKSNLVPFASKGASIPSATPVPNQNDTKLPTFDNNGLSAQKGFQTNVTEAGHGKDAGNGKKDDDSLAVRAAGVSGIGVFMGFGALAYICV